MKAQMNIRSLVNRDNNIVQLLVMTVLIFAVMTALSPDKFLRYYNFESITYIFPELGLLSIAMMIAMLTGGIDLSVVGVANLSGILAGVLFHKLAGAAGVADTGILTVLLGGVIALGTGLVAAT